MKRFKITCILIAVTIAMAVICSSCTASHREISFGYSIERVYKFRGNSMAIYKVKTPDKTYTVLRDQNGGMTILK